LRHSFAYGIGTILNRAANFIMLPLYTRYLSKSEYGALEILLISSSVLLFILQLGLGSALFHSILYRGHDRKKTISTALYFLIIYGVMTTGILAYFSRPLSVLLFNDPQFAPALVWLFIGDFFLLLHVIPMSVLRIDQKSVKFSLLATANLFFGIFLNTLALVILDMGLVGVVLANALAALCFALVFIYSIHNELRLSFSFAELRSLLIFGLPLVPNAIGDMTLMMADRYFINFYWDLETLANYSAAIRIGLIMGLCVNAFQMGWPAILFPLAKEKNGPDIFARLYLYYLFALVFIGSILSLYASEIISLLATDKYLAGASVIPIICFSFVFYGTYYYSSIGILVEKKTYLFPIIMSIAALSGLVLNFVLVPQYHIWGASFSKLFSTIILGVGIVFVSQKYYFVPYDYPRILKLFLSILLIIFIGKYIDVKLATYAIFLKAVLVLFFPILLYYLKFFNKNDLQFLHHKMKMLAQNARTL
jgi:O-antigen/teichoic acid export membrane protein